MRLAIGFLVVTGAVTALVWVFHGYGGSATRLAESADREDRLRAIDIARRKTDGASRGVLFRLSSDGDLRVAVTATWALGDLPDTTSAEMLQRILSNKGRHPRVRGEAAAALGKFKKLDPGSLIRALTDERDPQVRAGAARGMLYRRNTKTIPALVGALDDPDERVRRRVIEAIHAMCVMRFPYHPELPAKEQPDAIRKIREFFRRAGVL